MKKIKKRLICLILCICMCSSLFVYAGAIEPLDGTIDADDDATLIKPTLEVSTTPTGAVAVGHNILNNSTYYYCVNGNILSLNPGVTTFTEQGWMPDIENAVSPSYIIGDSDEREIVDSIAITQNPHRAIGLVAAIFPDGTSSTGTVTMIGPDEALTAAHCVYDAECGGWAISLTVYIGVSGSIANKVHQFPMSGVRECVISTAYYAGITDENSKLDQKYHDWGLLRLNASIGNSSGYLGFQYKTRNMKTLDTDPLCLISGYPKDLNTLLGSEIMTHCNQYYTVGEILEDTRGSFVWSEEYPTDENNHTYLEWRYFKYDMDATQGQSGSAILWPDMAVSSGFVIIGIVTLEEYAENKGVGITSQLFSFMSAYVNN